MFKIKKPFTHHAHPSEVIRQFTPNWFAVTMGTGVTALALNQFPGQHMALHAAGALLWRVNIGLFVLCAALYAARWMLFPQGARRIAGHPVMAMFLGAIPMGLATIVNGFLAFSTSPDAVAIATGLWWVDALLAAGVGVLVPYLMFTRQPHSLESMTAVWLLPIVPAEVAAVSAGLLAPHLASPAAAEMLFAGYALWALSVPLALGVLVILFLRLALHKLPAPEMAVTSWLCMGPLGTASLGLLVLGRDAPGILAAAGLRDVGLAAHGMGLIGGLMFWAYGAWWLVIAVAMTIKYLRQELPFNLGWWGFTFPLGVFTLATLNLGSQTGMPFFSLLGGGLVAVLTGLWGVVALRTIGGGYHGRLFASPCLAGAPPPYVK